MEHLKAFLSMNEFCRKSATYSGTPSHSHALGLSTVREIIDLESARIVYKSLNGDAPSYTSAMFIKVNVSTTRSLRNSDYDLRVPFLRTSIGQRCLSYLGAKFWNGFLKRPKIRQL